MSNKKRISKKIITLQIASRRFEMKYFSKCLIQSAEASEVAVKALGCVVHGLERLSREVRVFGEYKMGIVFDIGNPIFLTTIDMVPNQYKDHFKGLVKAGFSEDDAFDTLQETYNFK